MDVRRHSVLRADRWVILPERWSREPWPRSIWLPHRSHLGTEAFETMGLTSSSWMASRQARRWERDAEGITVNTIGPGIVNTPLIPE